MFSMSRAVFLFFALASSSSGASAWAQDKLVVEDGYFTRKSLSECAVALSKLEIGKTYRIRLGARETFSEQMPKYTTVASLSGVTESGLYEFQERVSGSRLSVSDRDLAQYFYFSFDEVEPGSKSPRSDLSLKSVREKFGAFLISRERLADRERFRLVKKWGSSETYAKRVVRDIERIDAFMKDLGFRLPDYTKAILNAEISPGVGSMQIPRAVYELRHESFGDVIYLAEDEFVEDYPKTTVMHERIHSILFATYQELAFVNDRSMLAEALADFIPALFLNTPAVGHSGYPLRNIEIAWTIPQAQSVASAHYNSLMISNFLWRLKARVGAPKLASWLKPWIDAMNIYFHGVSTGGEDMRNYALATLLGVIQDPSDREAFKATVEEGLYGYVPDPEKTGNHLLGLKTQTFSEIASYAEELQARAPAASDSKERGEEKPATGRRSYLMNLYHLARELF